MIISKSKQSSRGRGPQPRRKGGILTAEMVLIFPIALVFFVGIFEISTLLLARHRLHIASYEGARVGVLCAPALGNPVSNPTEYAEAEKKIYTAVVGALGGGTVGKASVIIRWASEVDEGPQGTCAGIGGTVVGEDDIEYVEVIVYASVGTILATTPNLVIGRCFTNSALVGQTVLRIRAE